MIRIEFACTVLVVAAQCMIAKWMSPRYYRATAVLNEAAVECGFAGLAGILLSWLFSFHRGSNLAAAFSCALFMSWTLPMVIAKAVDDWRVLEHRRRSDSIVPGLVILATSLSIFSGGAYWALINSNLAAHALLLAAAAPFVLMALLLAMYFQVGSRYGAC